MASRIATYKFIDYKCYMAARDRLDKDIGGSCYETTSYGDSECYIHLLDSCSDPRLASQICKGNGGEVYSW